MSTICGCGLLKVKKFGTLEVDGVATCRTCGLPLKFGNGSGSNRVAVEMITTLDEVPGFRILRTCGVVTELTSHSGWTATTKGNVALDQAMESLRRSAALLSANAVVGLRSSVFGAGGGITGALGGDAVGVLLMGDAVVVVAVEESSRGVPEKAD